MIPETIDRGDPRFLQLLQSIYIAWGVECKIHKFEWNKDRIEHCLKNISHGEVLGAYCQDLIERFSYEALLRILNKHVYLSAIYTP